MQVVLYNGHKAVVIVVVVVYRFTSTGVCNVCCITFTDEVYINRLYFVTIVLFLSIEVLKY